MTALLICCSNWIAGRTVPRTAALIILIGAATPVWAETYTGTNAANPLGAVCSVVGAPAAFKTWTCLVPNGSGSFATISGVPSLAGGGVDLPWLGTWVATHLDVSTVAIGNAATAATDNNAVAVGPRARATTESATAIGDEAAATGLTSTAIGFDALAQGQYSVAIGSGARALGDLGYALGNNALAGDRDVAIGAGAGNNATGSSQTTSIGFGAGAQTTGATQSVYIGADSGVLSSGSRNTYVGRFTGAGATGDENLGQGTGAGALVGGDGNVAIGQLAGTRLQLDGAGNPVALTPSTHDHAISIGTRAHGQANDAIAVGRQSSASAGGAVAVGLNARATAAGGVAIGADSVADVGAGVAGYVPPNAAGADAAAIAATQSTAGAVAVGDSASGLHRQITGVAAGRAPGDAVNVAQLTTVANRVETVADQVSIVSNQLGAVAGQVTNVQNQMHEAANRWVTGAQTGPQYRAPSASGEDSTAVGSHAQATASGGVALGSGAVASREAGVAGFVPQAADGRQSEAIAATRSTRGAVAVGHAEVGEYRQITGVAAGSEDGDAVNVSQLRAVSADVAGQTRTLGARIDAIDNRIHGVERGANAGVAAAMAMAGMPQAYLPGKSMLAASAGSFRGETALALGMSRLSDNGRWVTKLNGSANSRGHVGVAVGAGFHW